MGARQRREVAEQVAGVPDGEERVLVATGRYIGEGFDDARLDTLFLAMPVSWRAVLQQYAGRLHRLHEGKRVVMIYDYADVHVPVLVRMYGKRLKGYRLSGCLSSSAS
ncbi:MAG: helicase [Bacillota bacterium]|nr:helicase [Bacillota bacterium]